MAMDPIKRMFAELEEANGSVRIRFHTIGKQDYREQTMPYRQYRVWLATAASNGLQLEQVEQVSAPH